MNAIPSVDASEVAKFAKLADQWWDASGPFAPLHHLNPVRLTFIRDVAATHFGRDSRSLRPFDGLSLLDLGCGGGLLSEPLARIGFSVTATDAAEENILAATEHAAHSDLTIKYERMTAEQRSVAKRLFDVVLSMEVVEHVPNPGEFLQTTSRLVNPGGLLVISTINRTLKSLLLAKIAAEYVLQWIPAGTHDWAKFVPPEALRGLLEEAGFRVLRVEGMSFDPLAFSWSSSRNTDVNYLLAAERLPDPSMHGSK
jgi:2-polyprenyl-6-hydroxyphenyl methylase/3-demethylubiquinone-9 3-methyltransferase